MRTTLVEVIAW